MLGQGSNENVATALKGLEPDAGRAAVMKTAMIFALRPNVQERVGIAYANKKVPSSYFTDDADENEQAYASALGEYESILKHGASHAPQNSAASLDKAMPNVASKLAAPPQTNGIPGNSTPSQSPNGPLSRF